MSATDRPSSQDVVAKAVALAQRHLGRTQEEVSHHIAAAIQQALKPSATDREREQLAHAIESFLR